MSMQYLAQISALSVTLGTVAVTTVLLSQDRKNILFHIQRVKYKICTPKECWIREAVCSYLALPAGQIASDTDHSRHPGIVLRATKVLLNSSNPSGNWWATVSPTLSQLHALSSDLHFLFHKMKAWSRRFFTSLPAPTYRFSIILPNCQFAC
jgi:hypothetical protein